MLNLREITNNAINNEFEAIRIKKEKEEQEYQRYINNWVDDRKKEINSKLKELEDILVESANNKNIRCRIDLDYHRYEFVKVDPLLYAYESFAIKNNIEYKIDSYPVYELDDEMRTTNHVNYHQYYVEFDWSKQNVKK